MNAVVRDMPGDWFRATVVFPGGRDGRVVHVCGPNRDDAKSEAEKYLGRAPPLLRAMAEHRFAPRATWSPYR